MLHRGSCWSQHPLNHIYHLFLKFKLYTFNILQRAGPWELKETIWSGMEIAARPTHCPCCTRQTSQAVAFCWVSEQSTPSWLFFLNRILSFRLHTVNLSLHAYFKRAKQALVTTWNSPVKAGVPASCDCSALAEEISDSLEIWSRLVLGPVTSKY